jgi:hypothetical protein
MGDTMNKRVNAPQLEAAPRRTNEYRRMFVRNEAGLYEWWTRTCLPLEKFVQDNRMQIDECIDRELNRKCKLCEKFFARYRCNKPDECDCPKCQGMCTCPR